MKESTFFFGGSIEVNIEHYWGKTMKTEKNIIDLDLKGSIRLESVLYHFFLKNVTTKNFKTWKIIFITLIFLFAVFTC